MGMTKRTLVSTLAMLAIGSMAYAQGATATQDEQQATQEKPKVEVKLLDAGTGEKSVLRYNPHAGLTQVVNVTNTMDMSMDMGEMGAMDMNMKMNQEVEAVVSEVNDAGDITFEMKITDVEIAELTSGMPGVSREMLQGQFDSMIGTGGTATVSNRGIMKKSKFQEVGQMGFGGGDLEQMAMTFMAILPEEEIGPGARWSVAQDLVTNEMKISMESEYTLVARDGDVYELKVDIKQTADEQEIEAQQGMTMTLSNFTGEGNGKMKTRLDRIAPETGTNEMSVDVAVENDMMAMQQTVASKGEVKSKVKEEG